MASTQYQVFCRYLNENCNRALTNKTEVEWISASDYYTSEQYYNDDYDYTKETNNIIKDAEGNTLYAIEYTSSSVTYKKHNNDGTFTVLATKNISFNKNKYDSLVYEMENGIRKYNQFSVIEQNLYNKCAQYNKYNDMLDKETAVLENIIIRPRDSFTDDSDGTKKRNAKMVDQSLSAKIIEESTTLNPKYDMVFMYDGIGQTDEQPLDLINKPNPVADVNPPKSDSSEVPYLYYDKMKRIKLDPWFLLSTHASLQSAMTKAKTLVNILGKDAVKIGKVVPLDQYIEIV